MVTIVNSIAPGRQAGMILDQYLRAYILIHKHKARRERAYWNGMGFWDLEAHC